MVEGSAMKAQALGFGVEVSGRCPWRRRLRVSWFGFLVSGFRFQVWGFTFRSSACELRLKVRGVNFCGGSGVEDALCGAWSWRSGIGTLGRGG